MSKLTVSIYFLILIEDNNLLFVGRVVKNNSKMYNMPILPNYYISVCAKLGSSFIDMKCRDSPDPIWTLYDVGDKNK